MNDLQRTIAANWFNYFCQIFKKLQSITTKQIDQINVINQNFMKSTVSLFEAMQTQ